MREALLSLGLGTLVDMLADGDDAAVEAALEALCKSEA
jgi:hypothetical protein